MFTPAMRDAAAKQFADEYEDEVREDGSVPAHLKKHQKVYGEEVPVDANLRPVKQPAASECSVCLGDASHTHPCPECGNENPGYSSYASSPASRRSSSNGPGPGWHGERGRHAEAARMGHRRRR